MALTGQVFGIQKFYCCFIKDINQSSVSIASVLAAIFASLLKSFLIELFLMFQLFVSVLEVGTYRTCKRIEFAINVYWDMKT